MKSFRIKIAGLVFELHCLHGALYAMCQDYLTDEEAQYTIEIREEDIAFEREKSDREREYEGLPPVHYGDRYLETLAVYRKIAVLLPSVNGCVFHGAVIAVDGEAYLFTAKSGTGKTTHMNLWLKKFGERAFVVNGDKPILRVIDGIVYACGTPWSGKENMHTNTMVPLKALAMLERDERNRAEAIAFREALPMMVQQVYRPHDAAGMKKTLQLIQEIGVRTKLYRIGVNMEEEAAEVAYAAMR